MRLRSSLNAVSSACRRASFPGPGVHLRAGFISSMLALFAASVGTPALAEQSGRFATRLTVTDVPKQKETVIEVTFTRAPTYIARFSDEKRRMIVDVMDADVRGLSDTYAHETGIVKSVLTQAFDTGSGKTTRLLIALTEPGEGSVSVADRRLVIRLRPASAELPKKIALSDAKSPPQSAGPSPVAASPAKPAATSPAPVAPPPAPSGKAPAVRGAALVSKVDYERRESSDWVTIAVSDYASYQEEHPSLGRSRLVIQGARLGEDLPQVLDVQAFGGNIQNISTRYDKSRRAVVIDVERTANGVRSFVSEQEGRLTWSFFELGALHSSVTGVGADGGVARKARTLHVDEALSQGMPEIEGGSDGPARRAPVEQAPVEQAAVEHSQFEETAGFGPYVLGQQNGYSGRRINIDLKDNDVHNVLRFLADIGQVNIITADNVSGSVTIKMTNVPWDQALEVVLQSKGLGMVRGGNIIRVAPLPQLEKEREMAIARRRQELQLAPLETRLIPVSYASAEEIQARAREVLSGRGTIAVDARTNVLIARDVTGTLDQVEELVRSLDTQTPQVLVEARIIEATSRYLREIGIQWGGDASFSPATGNATGLAFPSSVGITGAASDNGTPTAGLSPFQAQVQNPNFAVNLPATVGTGVGGAIGLALGSIDNNFNLNLRLSAAEVSGMVRILSSPRILTLDNHEARISQGTLIPFSQVSAQGVQTTFQEAKLQLLVQPHVTADGSVSMHVKINRDEPDFNQTSARGDPTILKREAETDLLVMDGHTAVIGGIYTRNTGKNVDQVPFFGDIPLLGLLFQHRRATDQRGELVIFLTPRIVNRAQALGR